MEKKDVYDTIFLIGFVITIIIAMIYVVIKEKKVTQQRFFDVVLERARNLAKNDVKDAQNFIKKMLATLLCINVDIVPKDLNILRYYIVYYKRDKKRILEINDKEKNFLSKEILKFISNNPVD